MGGQKWRGQQSHARGECFQCVEGHAATLPSAKPVHKLCAAALLWQEANGKWVHRQLALGGLIGGAQDEDEVQVRPSAQADVPQRGHGAEGDLCEDEQHQKIQSLKVNGMEPNQFG